MRYGDFIKGNVKNLYLPEVFGVGYVGDAKTVDENNKNLMSYNCWHNMLMRCYSETYQRNKPTYKKCEVCDDLSLTNSFSKYVIDPSDNRFHYCFDSNAIPAQATPMPSRDTAV